jgi:serine/threonine protein kinase
MENLPKIQKHLVERHVCILQVVEGEAQNIVSEQKTSKVVVKILHEDATTTDQMYFLHEVKSYRELNHPNILKLLGRCLETDPFLVLLEPCPSVSSCAFTFSS